LFDDEEGEGEEEEHEDDETWLRVWSWSLSWVGGEKKKRGNLKNFEIFLNFFKFGFNIIGENEEDCWGGGRWLHGEWEKWEKEETEIRKVELFLKLTWNLGFVYVNYIGGDIEEEQQVVHDIVGKRTHMGRCIEEKIKRFGAEMSEMHERDGSRAIEISYISIYRRRGRSIMSNKCNMKWKEDLLGDVMHAEDGNRFGGEETGENDMIYNK
jgi:hypothetical protein